MSNVTTFKFEGYPVRVVEHEGEHLFVIRDICNILGFSNPNRQLAVHTENRPLYDRIRTPGGLQIVRLVPLEDVERLLAPNHGRKAAALRRWLRTELLPRVFPHSAAGAAVSLVFVVLDLLCPPKRKAPAKRSKVAANEKR